MDLANLGPLERLAGVWEGDQGVDVAPDRSSAPAKVKETKYRERIVFEPLGPVQNGPQTLWGLRYSTTAWPIGQQDPFHEELGYWLWDADAEQVMRCFLVPRGVLINAGGKVSASASEFHLEAQSGQPAYGVLSNLHLVGESDTTRYSLDLKIQDRDSFSYKETTFLKILNNDSVFEHTDQNQLKRVK